MRNNGSKYVVLFALLISVVALSLGFAAFTTTLTISSSAEVKPSSTSFDVSLSTNSSSKATGNVTGTTTGGATAATASLTASKIQNIKATFTAPGQTVKYSFYAYNAGSFAAYLNSVAFNNVSGEAVSKKCTAKSGTTQSYVNSACNGITLTVKIGSGASPLSLTTTSDNISSHSLATSTSEPIEVTIEYASGSAVADGDFDVAFGDIVLTYGSAD